MKIPYEILVKYCKNECSPVEVEIVEKWLTSSDENLNLFLDFQKEWIYLHESLMVIPNKKDVWMKIVNKTEFHKKSSKRKSKPLIILSAIAFIAIISFTTLKLLTPNPIMEQLTHISTDKGEKSKVILADGSKVWLNSESKLSFSDNFNHNERKVDITGELYFEVTNNPTKEFIVDMGEIKIKVLGTSFNAINYKNEKQMEISLLEGKVEVVDSKTNIHMFNLLPAQKAIISKNNLNYEISNENTEEAKLWISNKLLIHNATLDQAIKKLERWYGVDIEYHNLDTNKRYTFLLNTETFREFLNLFDKITPIHYEIQGDYITISGK